MRLMVLTAAAYALGITFWVLVFAACILAMVAAFEYVADQVAEGEEDEQEVY